MADFATPEWIDEFAARAAEVQIDEGIDLTIEQRIVDPSPAVWTVHLTNGRVTVSSAPDPDATLRLASDRATAEAIHAGRLSAQRAFLDGALQVGGDIGVLIANRQTFDVVAGLLADVT